MNNLTPLVIGLPDTKKESAIIKLYSEICDIATVLVMNLQYYFDSPHFEIREMFDFLKAKDPKEWLYSKFIEYHGLTFPGMNLEKVIQFELVDIPKDYLRETMELRTQILGSISKSKELRFYFPLIKLFHESEDENCRDFGNSYQFGGIYSSPEFDAALFNHVRKFTVSDRENEALEAINKTIDSLNNLVTLGIIRNDRQRWSVDLDSLVHAIVFSLNEEKPLSINPNLPKFKGFGKHFDLRGWSQIAGRPEDIIRFEQPIPEQSEETPEDLLQSEYNEFNDLGEVTEDMLHNEDPGTEQAEANPEEVIQTE